MVYVGIYLYLMRMFIKNNIVVAYMVLKILIMV